MPNWKTVAHLILISIFLEVKPIFSNNMRLGKVDPSSFATPELVVTKHIDLKWTVFFNNSTIAGKATYNLDAFEKDLKELLFDVSDITIKSASLIDGTGKSTPVNYRISDEVKNVGSKLTIDLPSPTSGLFTLSLDYETSPKAGALQWLTPEQTLGKKHPYLFSQCQAIAARSLLPCQDTPAVKFTYTATVTHPPELTALMSAVRMNSVNGVTDFKQDIPIPSYLLAIAIGNLQSRHIGPISRVWGEPEVVEQAAEEFSETHTMLEKAQEICGPYVWKIYDLLIMPPSFPFGGMENPCLTFVTPTLLAGDKSLANVVAHEISHSWTGNLVTNKNFEHFWLNEGFTVFVEGKIAGRMFGELERDFAAIRNNIELQNCIQTQLKDTPELTKLVVNLTSYSPDDAFSNVPYDKGSAFLYYIEHLLGGPSVFEPFLKFYLQKFAYKSIETDDFKNELLSYFSSAEQQTALKSIDWDKWLFGEGMPPALAPYNDTLAKNAQQVADLWINGAVDEIRASDLLKENLSTNQKIYFLGKLLVADNIAHLDVAKVNLLEDIYGIKSTKNAEIRFAFTIIAIKAHIMDRMKEILEFANSNFRMKFVRPIYRELAKWPEAKPIAIENFNKVKNQMMKVCSYVCANELGLK